ncbi:MAG: FG-GAP repeat protein [Haliscomenobacter sp.]|nr:FG-GAP repeat protein [Haliscomenobacter sp.]
MKQPVRLIFTKWRFWGIALALFAIPFTSTAQTWDQVLKALASDAGADDQLGYSVAISGDYAIVGAWMDNIPGGIIGDKIDAGSAYIFERIAGTWTQVQKLTASDAVALDLFGSSVSISGNYAIVGARGKNFARGAAYIFERIAGTWTEVEKITGSDADLGGGFGTSVSISGDYAVVGAPNNDLARGDAFIFQRLGLNNWAQTQEINASDRAIGDQFGFSVAIDATYVVVGANRDDIGGDSDAGSAYFFEFIANTWTQVEKVVSPDTDGGGHFGNAVAIDGTYAVIGAPDENSTDGQAYVFERLGLNDWALDQTIVSSDLGSDDKFGNSVSISDNMILVGASDDDVDGQTNAGSAYFFELQCDNSWSQLQKITASDADPLNYFGFSVGISGRHALVGAPWATNSLQTLIAGSAYFYYSETLCETVGKYTGTAPYTMRMDFTGIVPLSPLDDTVCSREEIQVDVFLSNPGNWVEGVDYRFEIVSVDYNGVTSSVGYAAEDVVSEVKETLTNVQGSTVEVTYNLVIRILDCGQPTDELCGQRFIRIAVDPEPVGKPDAKTIYTCTEVDYDLQANVNNLGNGVASAFTWYSVDAVGSATQKNNPYIEGETFTSATPGAGPVITDVLTNLTSVTQTIIYRVVPTSLKTCEGDPFYITVTVRPKVQFDCVGCGSKINVTLDATTCSAEITLDMALLNVAACAAAKDIPVSLIYEALEVVVDDGVGADNIVTCPGQHRYLVRLKPGYENCLIWQPCWGMVNAEDKSAPLYTSWIGKCNVGTLAVPGQTELLNGHFTNSTAAFLCLNAEELFNKEQTWKDATSALFAGRPVFVDACHNNYCQCFTTLKATDELTYFTCEEIGSTYPGVPSGYEAWARLKRTFTATDCYGNFVQGYQHIYLVRPQAVTFGNELLKSLKAQVAGKCDAIVEDYDAPKDNCCGEVDYELDLACLVGGDKCAAPTAEEMLRLFKTKLRIQDSLDCVTDRGYAFFAEGADSKYKLLGCNYSFDAQVVNTFPVCGNGKKVLVKLSYFDWCNPQEEHGLENCTYVLLKWYDTQAPEFTDVRKVKYEEPERMCKDDFAMAQNVPVSVISTGAMDCTASVFTDRAGLLEYLGWQIKDNCDGNPSVSVLKMERWGLEYAYGIPLSADSCWYEETYQVMVVGGRPVVTGLAPGLYRFTVEAFDHCYNKATKALYFRVVDKIAPVMKCDDQLNITLSNAQGAGYGQQYPTQGYNYYGYARVNKADVDEGSWDNCGMDRIKLRRSYDAACQADFLAKGYG